MKSLVIVLLLTCSTLLATAQVLTNYNFAAASGMFVPLSGATSPSLSAGNSDEGYANALPIGFDFWYMGIRYSTISASSNGWLTLGASITSATPINLLISGGSQRPVLAPLWDDLDLQSSTKLSYLTSGTAGTRIFTVQYLNVRWQNSATGNTMSFQVVLHEGSGKIEYIYRQDAGAVSSPSASIGITATGVGAGNFLSVANNGASVSSTVEASITSKPITGNTYGFTPPVPVAPASLIFSSVGNNAITLNWSDLSSNETGFVIYQSTDGINYTFRSQTVANAISFTSSGLTASTLYYWKVYSVTEGGLSTALSGSISTTCIQPAAPTVTTPVSYCQNATATSLTASGSGILWGGGSGSVGGSAVLSGTTAYLDNSFNNKKTNFSTTTANVTITSVDYYIPAYQNTFNLVLSIYNSSNTIIATSSTTSGINAGAAGAKVSNAFNFTIVSPGDYSIGLSSGNGNLGTDSPVFPLTEPTGSIAVTGVSSVGLRVFNNIQFSTPTSATAPIPSTLINGTFSFPVTQTVGGCVSPSALITVNVTSPSLSQVPVTNLQNNYRFTGNANDAAGNNNGLLQGSPTLTTDRFNVSNSAFSFNGSSQYVTTANPYVNPLNFTVSIWFKTSTINGGKLIGFGSSQTGASNQYDRQIYMTGSGQLLFGVYTGSVNVITSPLSYNDNIWHLATASLSATTGMAMYIDGNLVASNAAITTAENTTGYWRMGYDNINGWTAQPPGFFFTGSLDDALIYTRVLSPAEINTLFVSPDGAGNNGPVCVGNPLSLTATTIAGATYSWTGPNGFTSSSQNPSLTFNLINAGLYTLQVAAGGCSSTAYTNVSGTVNSGQWTGNTSTDWATSTNWCTGVVPTSTTNVIIPASAVLMPTITGSVTCKNLTINSGATLTTSSTGILNIAGALVNNGTMNNNGTTNFNGTTGQQTFTGTTSFYNLSVSNASGLLLPANIIVANSVSLLSGTLTANSFNVSVGGNWVNSISTTGFAGGTGTVTFNGSSPQTIGGAFATTFYNLIIASNTSTVTLTSNVSLNGNLSVSSGTFDLSTFTANHITFAGALTVSNGATLKIGGTNSFPTNYTAITLVVASTVEYSGTNQTVGTQTYGNLTLSSASGAAVKSLPTIPFSIVGNLTSNIGSGTSVTYTAGAAITVGANVFIGASTTFLGSNLLHTVGGSWTNNGTFTGNTSTVTFTGPGAVIGGTGVQNFNNMTVSASLVSFSNGAITVSGNLATTSSGSLSQAAGGTLTLSGTTKSISGTGISIENLSVSGTITTSASFNVTGNLSVAGSLICSAGTVTISGSSKTITGAGTLTFSGLYIAGSVVSNNNYKITTALTVNGSLSATAGTVTFAGTSTLSGTANLFNATINGTSLQLSANAVLGVASVFTRTAGTLNVTSSVPNTVSFNGTGPQNVNSITYDNLTMANGNLKSAAGAITVNNSITIAAGTTFVSGAYTHSVYVDWNNNGTFSAGTGTIQFLGAQNSTLTGATTFNILTINNTNATTGIVLNNNMVASVVNMTQGRMATGNKTLAITTTRNGPGIIIGNIQRTHAFTTGVAYAFEGPDNTITFTSVSAVTSITVSVALGSISDFPFGGSIGRLYTIAVPSGTYNATLRLHYEDSELNGSNEATMALWNYNGTSWTAIGKSANSTTSNYVEDSGLTNITNRWTCALIPSVTQWNGSVNSNWNTAANWTITQGTASAPPAANDIVNLGTGTFINQPVISTAVSVKNIVFGSAQAVTLSIASGGSLTSGDISGVWATARTHTINTNNQPLTVNGNLSLSDGTAAHVINLATGTGNVAISGTLTESGGANITVSGAGNLSIGADFNYVSGTFTAGAGTVVYNGVVDEIVGAVTYYNLIINSTSAAVAANSFTVSHDLTVLSGELENDFTLSVLGNINITAGANLENNNLIQVGGNWNNAGNFTGVGISVIFNGSGTQTITATTFNSLVINKPVGSQAVLIGDVVLNGDLTVNSGLLDIGTYNCNRSVQGGTITLTDNATFVVGANNSPLNFSNGSLSAGSTVIADGTGPQLIFGLIFGNLIFRNGGLKTLVSPIAVNGDLTIESGATFDGGSQTLSLAGNWLNSGTFIPSSSTIVCTGTTKVISGNTTFNRFSVDGSYTILNDVTFNGLLAINSTGSFRGGSTIHTTLNGDLINSGTLVTLGTTTFTGNVLQTLSLINAVQTVAITVNFNGSVSPVLNSTSTPQYGFLNINNTGGVNPSVDWTILFGLTVGAGASFNSGATNQSVFGPVSNNGIITTSGVFSFLPSTAATVNLGTGFTSTGTTIFGGAGALTIAGTPVSFKDVLISNTNVAGITPSSAWTLSNNLTISTGSILNAGNYTHFVGGGIANTGTLNCNTSGFTMNGAGTQNIYSLSPFYNLTINNSTALTISSNVTVNGILNFLLGNLITGSNILQQPSSATITGASQSTGWVNGNLQKGIGTGTPTRTFEVGDATSYTPIALAFSNVTVAGSLLAFTTDGDQPNIGSSSINSSKSVNRFWTLTNNGVGFTNYSATLNFVPGDVDAGATTSAFKIGLFDGTTWTLPSVVSANPTNIQGSGITKMGDFAVGENCHTGTTISYAASPYCSSGGSAIATLTGSTGGTFSSTSGLSINSSTGTINLSASVAGLYVVTYSVAAGGGCGAFITTATVTVSKAPAATISYTLTPYCSSFGSEGVTLIGTSGGTFRSSAGLVIDATTGTVNITGSTAGTYIVFYTVPAGFGCSVFATNTVITITTQPFASGTYLGNPYCSDGGIAFPVGTATGLPGLLTSTPGLSIDPPTGVIDLALSIPGVYTVTYDVPAFGGCASYSNTATVAISALPSATITYAGSPFCSTVSTGAVSIVGTTGGVFSSSSGLSVDPTTGAISPGASSPGSYILTYTMAATPGCSIQTATATVVITSAPAATIVYPGTPYLLSGGSAPVTLSGSTGGTFSSTTGLSLDMTTGTVTLGTSTPAAYTVVYAIAAGAGCSSFSTSTVITLINNFKTWDGGAGTNKWSDALNWNVDGVPVATDNVSLTGANNIVINTAALAMNLTINNPALTLTIASGNTLAVAGNLTISAGVLNANNLTLNVGGDWTNNGTFNASTGTVAFVGSVTQNIGGTTNTSFNNMTVSNTAAIGVSFQSNQSLLGILTLGANVTVDADGSSNASVLKLISLGDNPTRDAAIGILPSGAQITGSITVQRFMSKEGPNNNSIYRYISSPVQNGSVADLQNEIPITGAFTGKSTCAGCSNNASMFRYNESVITDINASGVADFNDGYIAFPTAANSETLNTAQGYSIFVRGKILASTLWDLRGPANEGNVTPIAFPVSYTSSGNILNDGWNLVGNPFPSTIDWNASGGWTKTNLTAAVYITDNGNAALQYATWNGVVGTNGGTQYIATGQGFWVKANGVGVPILRADENIKAPGTQSIFFRQTSPANLLRITLLSNGTRDETIIHFRQDATSGFDSNADALKLVNGTFNLSSIQDDGTKLAINSQSKLDCTAGIALAINNSQSGNYTLAFSEYESFAGSVIITLVDNYKNISVGIRTGASYPFTITSDPATYGTARFKMLFTLPALDDGFDINASDQCEGTDADVLVTNSQVGANYRITSTNSDTDVSQVVVGTGDTILLHIPKDSIVAGNNAFKIVSSWQDCSSRIERNFNFNIVNLVQITSTIPGSSCGPGRVTLAAEGASATQGYHWYTTASSSVAIATQPTTFFTTSFLNNTTTYFVAAYNALGCDGTRVAVSATIINYNPLQLATKGDSLISNYENGNQWFLNNLILPADTLQFIVPGESGIYTDEVSIGSCKTSADVGFQIIGLEHGLGSDIQVYPNPVMNEMKVYIPQQRGDINSVIVFNLLGVKIGTITLMPSGTGKTGSFNMANLPGGVYILQAAGKNSLVEIKVIKD